MAILFRFDLIASPAPTAYYQNGYSLMANAHSLNNIHIFDMTRSLTAQIKTKTP